MVEDCTRRVEVSAALPIPVSFGAKQQHARAEVSTGQLACSRAAADADMLVVPARSPHGSSSKSGSKLKAAEGKAMPERVHARRRRTHSDRPYRAPSLSSLLVDRFRMSGVNSGLCGHTSWTRCRHV